jgi:hypothetical protein
MRGAPGAPHPHTTSSRFKARMAATTTLPSITVARRFTEAAITSGQLVSATNGISANDSTT